MAQVSNNFEIQDYNKIFNTPRDDTCPTSPAPSLPSRPLAAPNRPSYSRTISATVNGCNPLDFGYGLTPSLTTNSSASNPTTAEQVAERVLADRRRSSFGAMLANLMPKGNSSSSSSNSDRYKRRSQSNGLTRISTWSGSPSSTASSTPAHMKRRSLIQIISPESLRRTSTSSSSASSQPLPASGSDALGRRRSSAFLSLGYKTDTDGNEHRGPYAYVSLCQAQHMERVRDAEKNLGLTHNVDGLPLPNEVGRGSSRRSSVAHFFGLDKPLLAR